MFSPSPALAGFKVHRSAQTDGKYQYIAPDEEIRTRIRPDKTSFIDSVDTAGHISERSGVAGVIVLVEKSCRKTLNISCLAGAYESEVDCVGRWSREVLNRRGELINLTMFVVYRSEVGSRELDPIGAVEADYN